MAHPGAEMSDPNIRLFWPPQIGLRDKDVTHGQHTESSQFFRSIEDDGRKSGRHLRVQSDLDPSLNLIFTFNEKIKKFLCIDNRFAEIRHQADQRCVPFVDNLQVERLRSDAEGGGGVRGTLVKVVDPEAMRIWRTRLWNRLSDSTSTRTKHWAVRSFVTSFCKFQIPSLNISILKTTT